MIQSEVCTILPCARSCLQIICSSLTPILVLNPDKGYTFRHTYSAYPPSQTLPPTQERCLQQNGALHRIKVSI